jgi:hypothetical protein
LLHPRETPVSFEQSSICYRVPSRRLRRAASNEARRVRAAQQHPARRLSTSTASAQARDADPI